MLGFVKRFCYNFSDPCTNKLLYITYERPILKYCNIVWNPHTIVHVERIESVQKQFLLYALRELNWTSFRLPSYNARCMLINIQTLKVRREYAMIYFINDNISQRHYSPLLSQLNFSAPCHQLRTFSFL